MQKPVLVSIRFRVTKKPMCAHTPAGCLKPGKQVRIYLIISSSTESSRLRSSPTGATLIALSYSSTGATVFPSVKLFLSSALYSSLCDLFTCVALMASALSNASDTRR